MFRCNLNIRFNNSNHLQPHKISKIFAFVQHPKANEVLELKRIPFRETVTSIFPVNVDLFKFTKSAIVKSLPFIKNLPYLEIYSIFISKVQKNIQSLLMEGT